MDETNNDVKTTMPLSEILYLGLIGAMVYFHSTTGNDMILWLLVVALIVRCSVGILGWFALHKSLLSIAQGILANNPVSVYVAHSINPVAFPAIAQAIITIGAGVYVVTATDDPVGWLVLFVATFPHIFRYFVYNRLLQYVGNPTIQQYVEAEMKLIEEDEKRNIILQEELDKVMPKVLEAATERWKIEGLYVEEVNERDESDESDQERQSETGAGD